MNPRAPAPPAGRLVLRPYQEEAVKAAVVGLRDGGRGQLHMACGTGKTRVVHQVAQELAADGLTVIVCPSIALVSQTLGM